MGAVAVDAFGGAIGEAVLAGVPVLGIAGSAALSDYHETESNRLANGWSYCVTIDAVAFEVSEGARQLAVLVPLPGVVCEFDFQTIEYTTGGKAELAICG